jgi:hypothetical protein
MKAGRKSHRINNRYLALFRYLVRHKWYVAVTARHLGIPVRGLLHDLSKFRPSEFIPYARYHFAPDGTFIRRRVGAGFSGDEDAAFHRAVLLHQRRNPHHWQHWVRAADDGRARPLSMPPEFVREMVADWMGASLAQKSAVDLWTWWEMNRKQMLLHPDTEAMIDTLLAALRERYVQE